MKLKTPKCTAVSNLNPLLLKKASTNCFIKQFLKPISFIQIENITEITLRFIQEKNINKNGIMFTKLKKKKKNWNQMVHNKNSFYNPVPLRFLFNISYWNNCVYVAKYVLLPKTRLWLTFFSIWWECWCALQNILAIRYINIFNFIFWLFFFTFKDVHVYDFCWIFFTTGKSVCKD